MATTPEQRYWKGLKKPLLFSHVGPVTHVAFSPTPPFHLAVTAGYKIHLYDPCTQQQVKVFSKFKDTAYSGNFRHDGKLLVAGTADSVVKIFDVASNSVLRVLEGHAGPVQATAFDHTDPTKVFSGSDDHTVRLWDIPTQETVQVFAGHGDYVRSIAPAVVDSGHGVGLVWSGSYDHTVKLWDSRKDAKNAANPAMELSHGAPVETLLVFSGGNIIATAGANRICLWDVLSGGRLLTRMENHQKTVLDLALDTTKTRLLSGSLDGHVKIYDVSTYKVVHSIKFPSPVFSVGLGFVDVLKDKDNAAMAVGLQNGILSLRTRKIAATSGIPTKKESMWELDLSKKESKPAATSYRHFIRGMNAPPQEGALIVETGKKKNMAEYAILLRKFRYSEALDSALLTRQPGIIAGLIDELQKRCSLKNALIGRDELSLSPLLAFILRWITNPKFSQCLSPEIDDMFTRIHGKISQEIELSKKLRALEGQLDTIISVCAETEELRQRVGDEEDEGVGKSPEKRRESNVAQRTRSKRRI